jgi:hypothetical protein
LNTYLTSGDFVQIFKSIGKFYQIGFDMQKTCRFAELNYEVTGFLLNKTNNVTMDNIINNFQLNFFTFTDAVNRIAQVFFQEYSNFGKTDLGKVDDAE